MIKKQIIKEWDLWYWNANHIDFNFNQEGKFYLVCKKDNYERAFKIIFSNININPYMSEEPTEFFGNVIIGEYDKEFIKSYIDYGTELGDIFRYDIFYMFFKNEELAKEKVIQKLIEQGFKNYLDKQNVFHKDFKIFYTFIVTERSMRPKNLPFRECVRKTLKKENSEEIFNPICFTQLLNELKQEERHSSQA